MSYARTSLKGVMFYDSRGAYKGYTLLLPMEGTGAWLIDMLGKIVNQWALPYKPGYDVKLLPNGNLLYVGKDETSTLVDLEGSSGILLEVDWNGKSVWEYKDSMLHHACYRKKNGNTLVIKWVEVPNEIAVRVRGGEVSHRENVIMWGDAIQEINPNGKVTWEWLAHEHINPDVTIRCPICPRDTWTHANAVSEFPNGNVIVSFMKTNTLAIIEKRTGNIIWEWGHGQLGHQHDPTILDNGNILVFDNDMHKGGFAWGLSRVIEINRHTNEIVWAYGGGGHEALVFHSSTLGTCQRLPNGNTLICEGTTGRVFEVDNLGRLVWEFGNNLPSCSPNSGKTRSYMVCSAYRYGPDYLGLRMPVPLAFDREPAPGTQISEQNHLEERLRSLGY
ncbi:arylsulfotransferase family protein [Chloroflexota bacterium]